MTQNPTPETAMRVAKLLAEASQLLRAGRPGEAVWPLRQAAQWQPSNATILHDLGLACLQSGATGEAIGALQAAIAVNPRYADAHLRLGIALEAASAPQAALEAYRQAAAVQPSLADARYRAANLLETLGRSGEAALTFRRAAASAPKTTLGRIAMARALRNENRDEDALKLLRQALALDKGNATALELLGQTLADCGQFEDARTCLLRAIDASPMLAGSYYDVVRCRRIGPQDGALVERMQAAVTLPGLEPAQRSRLHLALGKAADDVGNHAAAMDHFDAAELARSAVAAFDVAEFEARVDRLIGCFTEACLADAIAAPAGHLAAPILIVGLPRSGTTLAEQILSCHAQVAAGGELTFWHECGRAWESAGGTPPDPAFLATAAASYTRVLQAISSAPHVTDKMPLNFQWAGLIHLALPGATIIHCRRNPIDTALSIHQTHFNPRMPFPTGGVALVRYMRAAERLSDHWRRVLPADRFIDMDYETLTEAPDAQTRRLVSACGLAWDPACLRPELNARVIKTPSKWQARQPIYRNAVDRWRAYDAVLGPLRALLPGGPSTK